MANVQSIKEAVIRGRSEGLDKVAADLNKVADAQEKVATTGQTVATVTDTTTKKQLSAANAYDRFKKSIDAAYASEQAYAKDMKVLDRTLAQGLITQEQYAKDLDLLSLKHAAARKTNDNFAAGTKLSAFEMQNLGFQLNDVATSLGSGSSPFQVMAQQGGQVYQVLAGSKGGVTGAVKDLGSRLIGLVSVSRLALGGVAGLGVAAALSYSSFVNGQRQLEDSLQGLGRTTKASVADLENLANAAAAAARISVGSSRDITSSFASTGKITTDVYTGLTVAVRNYADLTKADLAKVAEEFATAFADPAKGAADLDKKLNILSDETARYIQRLADTNQKSEAQRVLLKALSDNLPDATRRVTALGYAWQGVANFASGAYVAMGKAVGSLVDGPTLDQQLAAQRKLVDDLKRGAAGPSGRGRGASSANLAEEQTKLAALEAQAQKLAQQRQDAEDRAASKAAGDAARARNPQIEQLDALIRQKSEMTAGLNKPGANTALLMQALNGVDNQIAAITDADGKLLSVAAQLRQERELELKVIQAQTPVEKANAQAALDTFRAKKEGATDADAAAKAENAKLLQQAEIYAQLTAAQRQRITAAQEAKAAQQLELDSLGKTAGEVAELRANYQSYWDLKREADQTGTSFDEAQYTRLKKINAEYARSVDLLSKAKLQNDISFERGQLGRTSSDQQIASTLRASGLPVDLNSAEASALRFNAALQELKATSSTSLTGFISDIRNGTSAADALTNSLNRIADKLIDMATDDLVSRAFGQIAGGTGGGIFGSLLSSLGGGASSSGLGGIGHAHTGGIIGSDSLATKPVSMDLFRNAPRYHTGGMVGAGEVPIIAQKGEGVFTAQQMRAIGAKMNTAPSINVTVENHGQPAEAAVSTTPNGAGGFDVKVVMKQVETAIIGSIKTGGSVAKTLERQYNLNRTAGVGW